MKACVTVGIVLPTFIVPGISRSSTSLKNLKIAVVGAKLPIPRVSKKLVTNPVPISPDHGLSDRFSVPDDIRKIIISKEAGHRSKDNFKNEIHSLISI